MSVFGLGSAPGLTAFAHAGQVSGGAGGAALAVPILSAGNLLGRLIAGPASDRVGRCLALHVTAGLLVAACGVLATGAEGKVAMAALLGLGTEYGSFSALVPAATADAVPGERFGTAYGAVFTAWGAVGFVASVAAAELAVRASWAGVFLVFAGLGVVTWLVIALGTTPWGGTSMPR